MDYVEDINEKLKNVEENKEERKWLLLANDILDCLMIGEFFDNFIDENQKYNEEKYFDNMKKYSRKNLADLVKHKSEYAKTKIFSIC